MFGRKKSSPTSQTPPPAKSTEMVARGMQISTRESFSSMVHVKEGQEWSHGAISDAVCAQEGIEPKDYKVQMWQRSDGKGETYEPGKSPKSWF